jgi:hypothetical protein
MFESIMDSTQLFQVADFLQKPTVSPLSLWERVRVRGRFQTRITMFESQQT